MTTKTFRTNPADLGHPVPETMFRSNRATVEPKGVQVDRTGGGFGAGVIRGVALISRGEALGHQMWIDDVALEQVAYAAGENSAGVKSRFTHPSMSSDGTGKHLGRIHDVETTANGKVVGDLHFGRSAHNTPDGDLAEYVMELAAEDSRAAGLSIAFERDFQMEVDFLVAHGAEISEETGRLLLDNFQSPDPDNVKNLPHVRVGELRAADVVDEPAANPDGLFDRQPEARTVDELLTYAVGLSDRKPATAFGVDPERAAQFFKRWMTSHGVEFAQTNGENEMATNNQPAVENNPDPAPTRDEMLAELNRYVERFGAENGGQWFRDGVTFADACEKHIVALNATNTELAEKVADLENRLANVELGETEPVATGAGDTAKKSLERDVIKLNGHAPNAENN